MSSRRSGQFSVETEVHRPSSIVHRLGASHRDRRQYSAKKTLTVPSKLTFGNLTAQKKFNDVTLVCEDHKLEKAHKVILARK